LVKARDNGAAATWAIVALKSPADAKSRLRPYCSDDERHRLFFLMARQVLEALIRVPAIEKVFAVTASDEVERFVNDLGASVLRQPQDLGTQSAFAHALGCLEGRASPCPARVLMISGDLPMITPLAVKEFLDRCRWQRGVAIVPDRRRQGTNALLCSPPDAIEPCFGEDSLRRHRSAARARGIDAQLIESQPLSIDIDDHEDLMSWFECQAASAASGLDSGLTDWLTRHFSRAPVRAGVIANVDCA